MPQLSRSCCCSCSACAAPDSGRRHRPAQLAVAVLDDSRDEPRCCGPVEVAGLSSFTMAMWWRNHEAGHARPAISVGQVGGISRIGYTWGDSGDEVAVHTYDQPDAIDVSGELKLGVGLEVPGNAKIRTSDLQQGAGTNEMEEVPTVLTTAASRKVDEAVCDSGLDSRHDTDSAIDSEAMVASPTPAAVVADADHCSRPSPQAVPDGCEESSEAGFATHDCTVAPREGASESCQACPPATVPEVTQARDHIRVEVHAPRRPARAHLRPAVHFVDDRGPHMALSAAASTFGDDAELRRTQQELDIAIQVRGSCRIYRYARVQCLITCTRGAEESAIEGATSPSDNSSQWQGVKNITTQLVRAFCGADASVSFCEVCRRSVCITSCGQSRRHNRCTACTFCVPPSTSTQPTHSTPSP